MKKLIPLLFFVLISSSFVSASIWEHHFYESEQALLRLIDSYYMDLIKGREHIWKGCNAGTDALVSGYFKSETRKDYQQSHTKRAYEECMSIAKDENEIVCCLGMGTHQTQDPISHGFKDIVGYTPECIREYWGSNILNHASCEIAMLHQLLDSLPDYERQRLILEAGNAYDIFFNEDGTIEGNKYAELLTKSIGFTTQSQREYFFNAIATVGWFVKEGQGSGYENMYKANRKLPIAWFIYPIIAFIICSVGIVFVLRKGTTNWKYPFSGILFLFDVISIFFIISIITGKAFAWYTSFAPYTPALMYGFLASVSFIGLLTSLGFTKTLKYVSLFIFISLLIFSFGVLISMNFGKIIIKDYRSYIDRSVDATVEFLKTGEVKALDASGLDWCEGTQNCYKGTLIQAQSRFEYMKFIFLGALSYLFIVLYLQSTKKIKKK